MSLSDLFDKVSLDRHATNFVGQIAGPLTAPWPTLVKVAGVETTDNGTQHRRKAKTRGFYTDPSPGIYGVREAFESADRRAGKVAALKSFGLLHGKGDPVEALTDLYHENDFGLPRRGTRDDHPHDRRSRRPYNGC